MFRKRHDFSSHLPEELNLTPFLDVMITLIPFLMLSVSFATVVVVKAALPTPVKTADPAKLPPPFDLVTQASPDSIKVWLNPASEGAKPLATIPTPGADRYSDATIEAFHKVLVQVKASHPTERRMALDAAPGVSIERISQLMDMTESLMPGETIANRAETDRTLFPDLSLKGVYVP